MMRSRRGSGMTPNGAKNFLYDVSHDIKQGWQDIEGAFEENGPKTIFKDKIKKTEFSCKKKSHLLVVICIFMVITLGTYIIHYLINDFDNLSIQNQKEIEQMEHLFNQHKDISKRWHERSLDSIRKQHKETMKTEEEWIIKELQTLHKQHKEVKNEHETQQLYKNIVEQSHESVVKKAEKIDNEINEKKDKATDEVNMLLDKIRACQKEKSKLEAATPSNTDNNRYTTGNSDYHSYQYYT